MQERLRTAVQRGEGPETLLLLEHSPVITMGRSSHDTHVLIAQAERERRGVELVRISRGGDVTYHGPGQLVGYPIRRIGRHVRQHVVGMADGIVNWLARLGIASWWRTEHPGVWTAAGKIGAVGVDASGGVTMHGFALNLSPELAAFQMIVPCGLTAPVTSVEALLGSARVPTLEHAAQEIALELAAQYGTAAQEVPAAELWELLQ